MPALLIAQCDTGALTRHVTAIDSQSTALEIRFAPELDARLLDETLAVERQCCSFFRLDYDSSSRRLSAWVERKDQQAALEAIASALTG